MKNIVIGQFVPGSGFFYKLDPRTKIMAIIVLMVSLFLLKTMTQLLVALAIAIILLLIGKLSIVRIVKGLKPIFVLLIFTFFFQIFFNKTGALWLDQTMSLNWLSAGAIVLATVLWRVLAKWKVGGILPFLVYLGLLYVSLSYLSYGSTWTSFQFQIYEKGVEMSVFVVIRLLIIITLSTVLTLTTKPTDLTMGMEKLLRPLKFIGINSEEFALIISISLRYIPTILDEANKIMLAQASRGADFSQGKLKEKVKQVISLLVPMFIIAFKRSEELADAMESRNFVPGKPRSRIYDLVFGMNDIVAFVISAGLLAAAITIQVI
ncbi:MAG: energy-coupling factor transporter transmembrane protein EcfT [Candidatus Izemoplasmatales bacterium]